MPRSGDRNWMQRHVARVAFVFPANVRFLAMIASLFLNIPVHCRDIDLSEYCSIFVQLIVTPFEHLSLIWGIVPLYFGLALSELTSSKANYRTALQTGFSFIWAAMQWLFAPHGNQGDHLTLNPMTPINYVVTFLVLGLGVVALVSGFRHRFPQYCQFLGHTRFANYFTIAIYPMQTHYLIWTWGRLGAVIIFAIPFWLALYFGLMPFRGRK